MKHKLTFEFDNPEALRQFAVWLCEQGEQDYWQWMEVREQENDGNITATHFDYHNTKVDENGKPRYGKFLEDGTIRCTCGSLHKGE